MLNRHGGIAAGVTSVVIPTFNEGDYLGETLDALVPQLGPGDEIVVVDSYSRDATPSIAGAHGARVVQAPREGIGAAKSVGIRSSASPVVAFLDADGIPEGDWLSRIRTHFESPDVLAVAGLGLYRSADPRRRRAYNAFSRGVWWLGTLGYAAFQLPWLPVNNCAFRKEVVTSRGAFRSVVCEDLDFAVRARGLDGVVYDPKLRVHLSDRRFRSRSFLRQVAEWALADLRILFGRPLGTDDYGSPR